MRRPNFNAIAANLRALQYQPIKPIAPVKAEIRPAAKKTPKKKKTTKPQTEQYDDDLFFDDDDIEDVLW